nr:hypothetical protein [Micromonospora zingiberis]
MSETGQSGAATPGEHGDGTGQRDDLARSGNGWAPPTGDWSWSAEAPQDTGERWRVIPPPSGWSTASPRYADLPAPVGDPAQSERSERVNGHHQLNGVHHPADDPSGWHAPVSAPPGPRDSGHEPGQERLVLPAQRPVPASERPAPPTGALPTSAPPVGGLPTSAPPAGALPTSAPPVGGLPTSAPPAGGLPTSAPPAMQVPPVGTAASGFEMPPGLHAPSGERGGDEYAGGQPYGWGDPYRTAPSAEPRSVPADPAAAAGDQAPTDSAGPRSAEPPAAETEWPSWARSGPPSDWAPAWAQHEGDPSGRRSRETPGQTWAHEPSRPYEPVRAESTRPYEAVRVEQSRPYEPSRSAAGHGPEAVAPQTPPGRAEQPAPGRAEQTPPGRAEQPAPGRAEQPAPGRAEQTPPGWAEQPAPGRAEQPPPGRPDWAVAPTSTPPAAERPAWGPRTVDESPAVGAAGERPAWAARPVSAAPADEGLPWGSRAAGQPPAEERLPWGLGPASAPPASAPPASAPPASAPGYWEAPPEPGPAPSTSEVRPLSDAGPLSEARPLSDARPAAEARSVPDAWSAAEARPVSGAWSAAEARPVSGARPAPDLNAQRPFRLRPVPSEPTPARPAPVSAQPDPASAPTAADPLAGANADGSGRHEHGPSAPGMSAGGTGGYEPGPFAAGATAGGSGRHEHTPAANGLPNVTPYAARRSAPEPVPPAEPGNGRSPDSTSAVLPQRVPAEPDVPVVPEPPAVEPPAETPELARIATHLRRDDEPAPLRDRPEGFDVNAILDAVRGVEGVRDAALRRTPAGAHSLRLDLADGADPAEVSRQVARLLQERMGLAAAPRGVPTLPAAPVRRRTPDNRGGDSGEPRAPGEPRRPTNRPAGARAEAVAARAEPAPDPSRRRRPAPAPQRGRATVEETGATGSPVTLGASYSGGQLTTTESAPSRPLDTGGRPGPRVVLDHVQVSTFGLDATVEVRLIAGEQSSAGYATGPAVDGYVLRLCAVAAAASIDELLRGASSTADRGRCFVEHAAVVPFGNCEVATVVVLLVCDGWVEQLAGSALVAGDPRQAVVRATLAAVNRRLEALLA